MARNNPFEFDAAPNLDPRQLIDWYIENNNYSRFFQSTRNVIINGERGSGKSMTLIYQSVTYKQRRYEIHGPKIDFPGDHLGIYIPCNTPLSAKEEYRLLEEVAGIQLSEASLTASIITNVAREFESTLHLFSAAECETLKAEFAFYLEVDLDERAKNLSPFEFLRREGHARVRRQQRRITKLGGDDDILIDSFSNIVLPILASIRRCNALKQTHLSLLIDDIQDLNEYQQRLVNSWIGYRDHSIFSIKAAVAGLRNYSLRTTFGGALLEGHDYITVDLQRPIQNNQSEFGKFARDVVKRRLAQIEIKVSPEEYFPVNDAFVKRLEVAKRAAEAAAVERGYEPQTKQYRDFVYKQKRAYYFRERDSKANKPMYSGFDTLVHLSTGVIRNLLQPCFYMYEKRTGQLGGKTPTIIPSDVQDEVVKDQSDKLWDFIEGSLERRVPSCSAEDARRIFRLFTRLAEYFRQRLLGHDSEPRVVTFVVSEKDHPSWSNLEPLLQLSERAQILYVRDGTSKRGGGRETYYVPNRMLWPRYGLDAHGQHGRASLRARDLWAAADKNVALELVSPPQGQGEQDQGRLFAND